MVGTAGVIPDPIKDDTVIGRPPSETLTDLSDCGGGRQPSVGRESEAADVFLNEVYRRHNRALYKIIGRDLGWHEDPAYWYYQPLGNAPAARAAAVARGGTETCGREPSPISSI